MKSFTKNLAIRIKRAGLKKKEFVKIKDMFPFTFIYNPKNLLKASTLFGHVSLYDCVAGSPYQGPIHLLSGYTYIFPFILYRCLFTSARCATLQRTITNEVFSRSWIKWNLCLSTKVLRYCARVKGKACMMRAHDRVL